MSEVKTIKYRFYRSKVPRCEKIEYGLPCDDFRHKSGRSKRSRRASQKLLVGKMSVIHPKTKKEHSNRVFFVFGADCVSRQKQLSVVFVIANAIKQGVIRARLVLALSTTMFQALEPENPKGSWRVDAPLILAPKHKKEHSFRVFLVLERIT